MLRLGLLACSLFCLSLVGCGANTETSVPEGIQPLTEAEQQAAEDYGKSQQLDPRTGQPKG
tara:strand:- start:692 stop:874 length:183 start_codon:yes stop_codon:yes gene_type:complete